MAHLAALSLVGAAATSLAAAVPTLALDILTHHNGSSPHHGGGHAGHDSPGSVGSPRAASMVGWLSIACWIAVYQPQLWLCVVQQSGEGLSLVFLFIWLAGDLTNLFGAGFQGLLPTMIILAVYYAVCDVILISQVYYYRHKRANYPHLYLEPLPSETDPLLSSLSAPIPASNPKARVIRDIASYVGGFALVVIVGVVAWKSSEGAGEGGTKEEWSFKGQVLGWSSAFLYLSSRIPQIYKNTQTKCQGLSLLMFAFALCGNATYVASILLVSVEPKHLSINASWLVGSGGTIFLDMIVLTQFWWYAKARKEGAIFISESAGREEE